MKTFRVIIVTVIMGLLLTVVLVFLAIFWIGLVVSHAVFDVLKISFHGFKTIWRIK